MTRFTILLTALSLAVLGAQAAETSGLRGEYFNIGNTLEDFPSVEGKKPVVDRVDKTINFESTQEAFHGVELVEQFYVRWTGKIKIPKDGRYTFYLDSDDGSRLFIDGKQIIDHGGQHAMEEKSGSSELKLGEHEIKVEFFENEGDAGCKLSWQGPDLGKAIVPTESLSPAKTTTTETKPASAAPAGRPGLQADYFQMEGLGDFPTIEASLKATVARVDPQINFESTEEAFGATKLIDNFYVRWTGKLTVPKEGRYNFYLESDDGSRLSIDGKEVINNGGLHAMEERSAGLELKGGAHEIKVEYFEGEVGAGCKLSWQVPGGKKEIIQAPAFSH